MSKFSVLSIAFLLAISLPAFAANRFSLVSSRPAPEGDSFFTVIESATLPRLDFSTGTALSYGHQPFKATLGAANFDIVGDQIDQHFYGAVGIANRLQISADMPVIWDSQFSNPDTLSSVSTQTDIGDLSFSAKLNLLNRDHHGIGIGIAPWITLPTGSTATFMGDDGATFGGRVIIDGKIGKQITVATNVGILGRKTFDAYNLNFGSQFLMSAGLNIKASKAISVVGEMETATPLDNFFQNKSASPTQARAGLQWRLGEKSVIHVAGTYGIISGSAFPHYGATLGWTYRSKLPHAKNAKKIIEQAFYFGTNSADIKVEGAQKLDKISNVLSKNPSIKHLLVTGHTDDTGTQRNNFKIGKRRAQAVQDYLLQHGKYPGTIEVKSFGEKNPAATNDTSEGRALNRRAEIHVRSDEDSLKDQNRHLRSVHLNPGWKHKE